jgi:hypothetical protein
MRVKEEEKEEKEQVLSIQRINPPFLPLYCFLRAQKGHSLLKKSNT